MHGDRGGIPRVAGARPAAVRAVAGAPRAVVALDRSDEPGSADDRGGPVDLARHTRRERDLDAALRGAVPLPPVAAAPAARPPDLRDVAADPAQRHRLL